jgi:hypothetical protein
MGERILNRTPFLFHGDQLRAPAQIRGAMGTWGQERERANLVGL